MTTDTAMTPDEAGQVFITPAAYADDAWFHLAPGGQRTLTLVPTGAPRPLKGSVQALNVEGATKIAL